MRHSWCWLWMGYNHGMMVDSEFLVYVLAGGIRVKEYQFVFDRFELVDQSYWHVSFDVMAHAFCVCISSKVKTFYSLSVNPGVHMLDHGIKWLLSFNCKSLLSLRGAVTGPILSLTTNHVCSSCFLDFGYFFPMI